MEGNIVKAAWILGGSVVLSTLVGGVGLLAGAAYFSHQFQQQADLLSKRSADAVLNAPRNTTVSFDPGKTVKVGFENKLPLAMRVENSMDDARGTRAAFEVDVKPTLNK